jgi:RNase H-like domain found in reverse transcriptase
MTVETDASDYAITAILSITLPNGEIHPVAFHSRTLSSSELNYDTHDKELLGVIILMVPELRWMWSPTIRIWNISLQPSY